MESTDTRPAALPFAALIAGVVWLGVLGLCALALSSLYGRAQAAPIAPAGVVTLTLRPPDTTLPPARRDGVTALPPGSALLTELLNTVELSAAGDDSFTPAAPGDLLDEGSQVRTGGGSSARLDFDDGAVIRIGQNTTVTLEAIAARGGSPATRLSLEAGQVWLSLRGRPVETITPLGVVTVHGSFAAIVYQFGGSGAADDVLILSCFQGPCSFQGNDTGDVVGDLTRLTVRGGQAEQQPLDQGDIDGFIAINPEGEALRSLTVEAGAPTAEVGPPTAEFETGYPFATESEAVDLFPTAVQPAPGYPVAPIEPPPPTEPAEIPTATQATETPSATATATTGTPGSATPSPTGPTPTLTVTPTGPTPTPTLTGTPPTPTPTGMPTGYPSATP